MYKAEILQIGVGYAYGSIYALFPVYVVEIFGKKKNSTVFGMLITIAFPLTTVLLILWGMLKDRYVAYF